MQEELLHGRGKWDTARLIAFVLAGFSVASWVLELSLGLTVVTDGPVDMMDRPPPVLLREENEWRVSEFSSEVWVASRVHHASNGTCNFTACGNFQDSGTTRS